MTARPSFAPVPGDGGARCDEVPNLFDIFGCPGNPPRGVTTVDTTFTEPGPLINSGCPAVAKGKR